MQYASNNQPSCENCGRALEPRQRYAKGPALVRYCSNACRQRAYRRRVKVGMVVPSAHGASQLSSFVGRDHDLVELRRLLRGTRLLTLTGPPGVGKSRLAMEVVKKEQRVSHRDTVVVDFCAPTMAALQPREVAAALETIVDRQVAPVRDASDEQLVLLENCDRVLDTCGSAVVEALFRYPGLRVIATSREPWRLSGEIVYRVAGLSLPAGATGTSPDDCLRADAVRLFVSRCRAVNHEFALTGDDFGDIAAICTMLDGLPLALELAAQLARALSVGAIRERLRDGTPMLNQGWRTADARHQSWHAALQWSYEQLTADEQRLFRRLCVMPGAWGTEATTAVYTDDPARAGTVPDLLIRLEAKSLLVSVADGSRAAAGFRVPASVLGFGRQQLLGAGEETAVMRRLTTWMTHRVERLPSARLPSPGELRGLAEEHEHLRHLLTWLGSTGDERQLSLAGALAAVEVIRGEARDEVLELVEHALASTDPGSPRRADALEGGLALACWHGRGRTALRLAPEAVSLAIRSGDQARVARTSLLSGLSKELYLGGDAAVDDLNTARAVAERCGDMELLAVCLTHLARRLLHRGLLAEAAGLLERAVPVLRASAPLAHLSAALMTAGALALERDDLPSAEEHFQEVLALPYPRGFHDGMLGLALCSVRANGFERALSLLATLEGRSPTALRLFPAWREHLAEARTIATRILPHARAAAALAAGRGLDLRQSLTLARNDAPAVAATGDDMLTAREWEVLRLVMEGLANTQIAHRMHLSVRTVETHIRSIRTSLGLRSRAHMAAWAARRTLNAA